MWHNERESAEVLEYGIRVRRRDLPAPTATIWRPKAEKPCANYRFRSIEQREAYIARFVESFATQQQAKTQRAKERRATAAQNSDQIGVGHIFRYSWGYDQTNIDYYQVVEKHGQNVTVRAIAQSVVPGSERFLAEYVEPRIGRFLENAKPFTKRVQFTSDGRAYLSMEFGWCELWRGGSSYQSHYA
jgi:hypothetical protein